MATKTARAKITFECTECKHRNYDSIKNKKNDPDRLVMNKYCPFCKKHTEHKASKKSISRGLKEDEPLSAVVRT